MDTDEVNKQGRWRRSKKKHMWHDEKIKHNWSLTQTIKAIKRWKPTKRHCEIKSFPSPSSPFMRRWHLTAEKPDHRPPASVSKRQALPQDAALCGRLIFVVHFNRNPAKGNPKKKEQISDGAAMVGKYHCWMVPRVTEGRAPVPPAPPSHPSALFWAHFRKFSTELKP